MNDVKFTLQNVFTIITMVALVIVLYYVPSFDFGAIRKA